MNNFVAFGRFNLLIAPETRLQVDDAFRRIQKKYQPEWGRSGFLKKRWIEWKIYGEMKAEIEKLAPSTALY